MVGTVSGVLQGSGLLGGGGKEEPSGPITVTTGPVTSSMGDSAFAMAGDSTPLLLLALLLLAFFWWD